MHIPLNPDTNKPYFSILEQGWGCGGWAAGSRQLLDADLKPIPSNPGELKPQMPNA